MTQSMIERVAMAVSEKWQRSEWDILPEGRSKYGENGLFKEDCRDIARVAIEAMHEPTSAMHAAGTIPTTEIPLGNGTTARGLSLGADQGSTWRRMIDAALNEEGAK